MTDSGLRNSPAAFMERISSGVSQAISSVSRVSSV